MAKKAKDPNKPKKTGRQPGKPSAPPEPLSSQKVASAWKQTQEEIDPSDIGELSLLDLLPLPGERTQQQQAQALALEGWRMLKPKQQVRAARSALELDPDCSDAIRLLAHNENNPERRRTLYEDAIAAAERRYETQSHALEDDPLSILSFVDSLAHALDDAAFDALETGDPARAAELWTRLLKVDVSASPGVIGTLAAALLTDGTAASHRSLRVLIGRYADEDSAVLAYSRALLFFREQGAGPIADEAARDAIEANPFIVDLLLRNDVPQVDDEDLDLVEDAVEYAEFARKPWKQTHGALDWLRKLAKN